MGAKCCCNDRGTSGREVTKDRDSRRNEHRICSTGSDGRTTECRMPSTSSALTDENLSEDIQKFDSAYMTNDIPEFVGLLDSTTPVHGVIEGAHPWVTSPSSVGALVAAQLATLAQESDKEKIQIREEGAMPKFVQFLKSEEIDRREVGALALSHLTQNNSANALEVYKHGGMQPSLAVLKSEKPELRSCARMLIRNMTVEGLEIKLQFMELGGVGIFLEQLKTCENADERSETVLDIQDIMEDHEGNFVAELQIEFKKKGGIEIMQSFEDSSDDELREAVSEFLNAFSGQNVLIKF